MGAGLAPWLAFFLSAGSFVCGLPINCLDYYVAAVPEDKKIIRRNYFDRRSYCDDHWLYVVANVFQ